MITFREVKCGHCSHRFMWLKGSDIHYRRCDNTKGYGVKCPKCGKWLVVFDKELIAKQPSFTKGLVGSCVEWELGI